MGSELDKVKTHIETFKGKIEASGVSKVNIGVATYGSPNTEDANFLAWTYPDGSLWSSDISAIKSMMAPITAPYGIDTYNYCGVQMAAETYGSTYGTSRYMVVVTDVDHTYYPDDSLAPGREAVRTTYTKDTVRAALLGGAGTDDDICLSAVVPSPEATSGEFYDLVNETGGILMKSRTDWGEELTSDLEILRKK